ncbi:T9SS type A sorting domain-containing protein [Fluviicola sp.]|jgi:PKD repeat protein|uniref:T9SS type A sorting domain-containing protein n=1 Tax=Fluviicola sp. TaxID=1917219 RepID=UPI0028197850|nr:T9SS type A sorting domain-containing protein [Fluviicola sp.]MDR0802057.1 T9SS type A sorting domain-containing protein [Fluviicola sp.]
MKKLTFNKMRRGILPGRAIFVLAMALISFFSQAQTVTTSVATGVTTTTQLPIYGLYGYTYSQQIYLASDFNTAVAGQPNYITKIRFFNVTGSLTNANSWTVYMGNTATASFANTTSWIPLANLTQVFSGNLTAPAANTWMEITLTTPFLWDGVSNVVVGVDENTASYSGITWRSQSTGANRALYYYNDATNPNPASPPTASSLFSYVPQAQFVHVPSVSCSGMPAHATAVSSVSTICSNSPTQVDFSATGMSFVTGLNFQWQFNNGSGWGNYPTGTSAVFSTNPTETINARLLTTCIATSDQDISEEVSVVVNQAPSVSVNNSSLAFCSGTPAVVTASGADTYTWTPATGLNVTNNSTVSANPANVTTYSVVGTDLAGCKDTAMIIVSPLSKIEKTASYLPTSICSPGSPVTVTANASPAVIYGGGAYEYRFIGANGAELQPWSSGNTYTFTPSTDSIYKIYYDFRSTTCPDAIDSSLASVIVGFGATASVVNYDCNNLGGTVSLNNTFGQVTTNTVYSNPFANAATDLTNVSLQGVAAITGGRAVLTPSATGSNGSIIITDPNFHPGTNNAMTLSFKMTADQPINVYGTGGADGISYSFADDISNSGNQDGSGSKLRLIFDAADNSPNITGIYLVYGNTGGVSGTAVTPTTPSTIYYSSNAASWKLGVDVQVVFTIDVFGKAGLTVGGATIFSNVQMPAAYMTANTATWKHVFSASTGGDALRQAISNVTVTAPVSWFALIPSGQTPSTWQLGRVFTNIQPGIYDVWMSSNSTTSCAKKIKTIEIKNLNPLVVLGNDTTICQGESLVLDAGNVGSTYVWSNSQITTQTRTVTQPGAYVVYVTNTSGCVGIGSVNVSVNNIPSANSALYVQNNTPTYTFTVLNPQNVDSYSWNFGDGSAVLVNAPSTVSHTYTVPGPYMVTATLTNGCGTQTVIQTIVVTGTAGIEENGIQGLSLYPNPASDKVTIAIPETTDASATVYSVDGTLVATIGKLDAQTELSVRGWNPGIYFVRVQSESKTSTIKLVIQ